MKIKKLTVKSAVTTILVIAVCIGLLSQSASALTSSQNVVAIGGYSTPNGGTLPTVVAGMTFDTMLPADVNDANLAPYDTVVMLVGNNALPSTGTLTAAQKTAIINFVANGNKLIIYDSEETTQDYSWLPYPFTTNNPGATGRVGVALTIVEENSLSSTDTSSPYYIDTAAMLTYPVDAVGDMNVMTTHDSHWCLDMTGTNTNNVFGPVHTYAKYPTGTDTGLFIYNGFDIDYIGLSYPGSAALREIWYQELQQSFNPSNLPCGYVVTGIGLTPCCAQNVVNTDHTVTATVTSQAVPVENVTVYFEVISGPNAGDTGTDVTDSNGEATFTYTGDGGIGMDEITAYFYDDQGVKVEIEDPVNKTWVLDGDIPEFPTIAVPVLAIVGLALFFNRRK
ncbi:PEF-CTERM sorting domain-containing protein [Methanolobus sediminis]|uniref:PEF-CTERM sorting domain-containing protein n=1 Tax=Methanolobus sediminis TaxID=3072978 RepID=A0AA51UMZ6_9EURY|nr:PEF-CTERM sorting domain-containing protein [Methanolobus sediminis]WMW26028.1 PEF-CTERM sorting domain-containing protein [Methanolobus sediminis]